MSVRADPYKYFRVEARELADQLGQGVLELEKGSEGAMAQLLRAAHTLKGAARVVKQPRIAEHAHAIEGALAPLRDGSQPVTRETIQKLLERVDEISSAVATLDGSPEVKQELAPGIAEEPLRILRADASELDVLLEGISESFVQLNSMRAGLGVLQRLRSVSAGLVEQVARADSEFPDARASTDPARVRAGVDELRTLVDRLEQSFSTGLGQAERELSLVRDTAERLRLTPFATVFPLLERAVRDAALLLGKQATFVAQGGDVRVDALVLTRLQAALVQVMRNAVAHGIETPAERVKSGKPEGGQIELEVTRRRDRLVVTCRDDGRGVDLDAVRLAAERAGTLPGDGSASSTDGLLRLLMKGGLTTSKSVTEVSGRGIGLDVVR